MSVITISKTALRWMALLCGAAVVTQAPLAAKRPEVRVAAESPIEFGAFMVFGSGSRTVGASGSVTDRQIVALEGIVPSPARFTVQYDRGNQSRHVLDVELELVFSPSAEFRQDGVTARLSALETTLPQAQRVRPGDGVRVTLRNCRARVCSQSFTVGGRLDVTRDYGGTSVSIPIPVDAAIISVDRVR